METVAEAQWGERYKWNSRGNRCLWLKILPTLKEVKNLLITQLLTFQERLLFWKGTEIGLVYVFVSDRETVFICSQKTLCLQCIGFMGSIMQLGIAWIPVDWLWGLWQSWTKKVYNSVPKEYCSKNGLETYKWCLLAKEISSASKFGYNTVLGFWNLCHCQWSLHFSNNTKLEIRNSCRKPLMNESHDPKNIKP